MDGRQLIMRGHLFQPAYVVGNLAPLINRRLTVTARIDQTDIRLGARRDNLPNHAFHTRLIGTIDGKLTKKKIRTVLYYLFLNTDVYKIRTGIRTHPYRRTA